jgi:hypothetical protein
MSSAAAAAAPSAATTALSPAIAAYLSWGQARLQSLGMDANGNTDAGVPSGVVPGAPLCVARPSVGEGCGLFLAREVPAGEAALLFRVPASMQFRAEHSELVASLLPPAGADTAWVRLTLALLAEWSLGPRSAWAGFLGAMPTRTDQPQFWNQRQLAQLQGCSFAPHVHFFDLRHEYESKVLPWLEEHGAKLGMFAKSNCSFDRFSLVTGWIISRAFRPACTPDIGPVMLPLVDLFNTTSMALEEDPAALADAQAGETGPFHRRVNCSVRWVAGGERGDDFANPVLLIHTLPSPTPLRKGQQLFLPYGSQPLGTADLLVRYGFVEGRYPQSENPHDGVGLSPAEIVAQLRGGGATSGPRGAAALTAPAEATEDQEARALHRKHKEQKEQKRKKQQEEEQRATEETSRRKGGAASNTTTPKKGGKRGGAAAAAAAAAAADESSDDDDESDSDGSDASGSSQLLDALSDLASSLPVESFVLPANGEPPARLLQFIGVVLGLVDGARFKTWLEGDAARARARATRELERNKRQAIGGGSDPPPPAEPAAAASPSADIIDEQRPVSPCPSPSSAIGGLTMAGAGNGAGTAAAASTTAAAAASSATSSASEPAQALELMRSSADVLEALFFLYHSLLGDYATTLEEDDRLLTFFEQREETRVKEWKEAQKVDAAAPAAANTSVSKKTKKSTSVASSSAASSFSAAAASSASSPPPDAGADQVRLLLALRARMSEKRVLYRALEWVQQRLASLAAESMDDGGSEHVEDAEEEEAAAAAAAASHDDQDEDDDDEANQADHPDPNILSPSLFKMLASQKRPLPDSARSSRRGSGKASAGAEAEAADDEEGVEVQHTSAAAADDDDAVADAAAAAATPIRFTYTKSTSRDSHARKKRRG